jgi:hypothetical protein
MKRQGISRRQIGMVVWKWGKTARGLAAPPVLFAVCGCALVTLAWPGNAIGAFELRAAEPRERGCGTVLALGPDGMPIGSRPRHEVALYGFRPFGVRDIEFAAASCRIGVASRVREVALAYERLGALTYCEEVWLASATLAAGRALVRPTLRLALAGLEGDLSDWALLADCHGSVAVTGTVWVGAGLENPLGLCLRRSGDRAPTTLRASAAILASGRVCFGIDLSKSNGFPTCLASGVEWQVSEGLRLRVGVRTFPREIALGVGFRQAWVGIDVATSINPDLGSTHEAGVRLLWR